MWRFPLPEESSKRAGATARGTSILLRLPPAVATELRRIAKLEERTITTIALRALRLYFKQEHGVMVELDTTKG